MIVLDTHVLVWWTLTPKLLSKRAVQAITKSDQLGVPSIVFWEIALLVRRGKLFLDLSVRQWAQRVCTIDRVVEVPLSREIALRADELPTHPDPADRFIMATALTLDADLVTKDARIRDGEIVGTIW